MVSRHKRSLDCVSGRCAGSELTSLLDYRSVASLNFTNGHPPASVSICVSRFEATGLSMSSERESGGTARSEHGQPLNVNTASGALIARTIPARDAGPDDLDRPHLTSVSDGAEIQAIDATGAVEDLGGCVTSSMSLAPGWRQHTSWITAGAGAWIGVGVFALAWTALLC